MNELVNVYVKTADKWELLYENIPEDIASEIWIAGFKTGENKISIDWKDDEKFFEIFERQLEKLQNR